MDILYIVDNKFRDLWGFKEIKEKLNNRNINLYFCNKYNWNLAIKYINPSFIIIPHIRNGSPHFQKISNDHRQPLASFHHVRLLDALQQSKGEQ